MKHEVPKSAPTKSSQPLHKPNGGDAKQVPVKGTGKPQEVKVQKDKKLEVKAVEKAEKSVQQDKNGAKSTKLEADKPKGDKSTKDKQGGDKKVENAKGGKKPEAKQAASAGTYRDLQVLKRPAWNTSPEGKPFVPRALCRHISSADNDA